MADPENGCRVWRLMFDNTDECLCSIEVPIEKKKKYYILVRTSDFSLASGYSGNDEQKYITVLVDKLKHLVGKEYVVLISMSPESSYNRDPIRQDFIDAYNDANMSRTNGIIFNYGHGNENRAGLIFEKTANNDGHLAAFTVFTPNNEIGSYEKDKEEYMNIVFANNKNANMKNRNRALPEKLEDMNDEERINFISVLGQRFMNMRVEINQPKIISKNYVCHQKKTEYADVWKKKLPRAEFYFEGRASEPEMLPKFLNDLVDEINGICPGAHKGKYKYKCITECENENSRCTDFSKCVDVKRREGIIEQII